MPLNKATGNMYPWVTHTWNTIKGECPHGCSYCYMKRWGKQNPAHLDKQETRIDLGCDNFIFVGSSCDMWADDIPDDWIIATLNRANWFENKYLLQTKNPARFMNFLGLMKPSKYLLCTTIETDQHLPETMRCAPSPFSRAKYISSMRERGFRTMVTVEPIMDFNFEFMFFMLRKIEPEQVNIGADSGNNHLPEPSPEKTAALIEALRPFTRVHLKKNLRRILPESRHYSIQGN